MRLVAERHCTFVEVPLGELFIYRLVTYWKIGPDSALTMGLPRTRVRSFPASTFVCLLIT